MKEVKIIVSNSAKKWHLKTAKIEKEMTELVKNGENVLKIQDKGYFKVNVDWE